MSHISNFCPYCHKEVTFAWVEPTDDGGFLNTYLRRYYKNTQGTWALGECPNCKNCVMIKLKDFVHFNSFSLDKISPLPMPTPTDKRIDDKIRNAINEAKLCLSVGAPMACATMCRRAIQCACLEKGATKKDLNEQINELSEKGIITSQVKDWAHSIRWVGNDGAHPNNIEVKKEDAEEILALSEELMRLIYVMPAIAKKHTGLHN